MPKGTPPEVVTKLNGALRDAIAAPQVKAWIRDVTLEPASSTPEEFEKLIKSDSADYGKVVQMLGLSFD